jgi:hypothetical protein
MSQQDTKRILWENITQLMVEKYGHENLTALARDAGFGPGTSTRLKDQKTSAGIDVIEKLAALFDLSPWQLLVPNLNAKDPPKLDDGMAGWPLDLVPHDDYMRLTHLQQGAAQSRMADEVARWSAQQAGGQTSKQA